MYTVIFVEPESSGNVGAVARSMKNFGFSSLLLVNPKCDCMDEEAKARAMHGRDILKKAKLKRSLEEACRGTDFIIGTTAKQASSDYNLNRNCVSSRKIAEKLSGVKGNIGVVIGREASGLSNEELRKCDLVVHIPASPDYPTLNVSHAAAIIFYELAQIKGRKQKKASRKEKEALESLMKDVVDSLQGIRNKKLMLLAWKRVLNRSMLSSREAQTIAGLFSEIKKSF